MQDNAIRAALPIQVFFISARVHPGETPASHVFNGMIRFLMDAEDDRAQALRDSFVFKLIPILNPDGVSRGHYRCDSQGLNLNRFYNTPLPEKHPSIYASRCLTSYHAAKGTEKRGGQPFPSPQALTGWGWGGGGRKRQAYLSRLSSLSCLSSKNRQRRPPCLLYRPARPRIQAGLFLIWKLPPGQKTI